MMSSSLCYFKGEFIDSIVTSIIVLWHQEVERCAHKKFKSKMLANSNFAFCTILCIANAPFTSVVMDHIIIQGVVLPIGNSVQNILTLEYCVSQNKQTNKIIGSDDYHTIGSSAKINKSLTLLQDFLFFITLPPNQFKITKL